MLCFPCLNDGQMVGRMVSTPALTIFNGQALCLAHLNTMRGLPAELPLGALPAAVQAAMAATPSVSTAALPAATATEDVETHETCQECDNYAETHYQPDIPHCSCGKPLVDGDCESTLDSDQLERVLY